MARHRAFIAPRLGGSLLALAAFPIYVGLRGAPGAPEVLVFVWAGAPILTAYFLSRTGRYEAAHMLSFLLLTGLVLSTAFYTGGIASFATVWLVLVPFEAALSGSRRLIGIASAIALAAAGFLIAADLADMLPRIEMAKDSQNLLPALGVISAALYATGLALGAQSFTQAGTRLLANGERRYQLLACMSTDVVTRHGRDGAVIFASRAAERLLGVAAQDLLGHGLFDRVHVADRPAYLTVLSDAALGVARSIEVRIRGEARNAECKSVQRFHWIEMRCRPFAEPDDCADNGEMRDVIAVLRDIDERKAQELLLETARVESERASTAKTRFIATMSHELRTPLNVIIGFSDMLTKQNAVELDAARRQEYARLINESGRHLLAVVNGILDMSKIEVGHFEITREPFALEQSIRQCCDLLGMKAREGGVEIVARIPERLPEIFADKRAVNQILLNLISNAVKFTNRGGRVSVGATQEGPWIVLTVEDTGIGIDSDDLCRIGEPFFQARASYDRRQEGTGLGLSIVKGLVKLHSGKLEIRSHPGEGTRIAVRLPVGNGPATADCQGDAARAWPMETNAFQEQVKKIA